MDATTRWTADLAAWAVPAEILAQAPVSPWSHPVDLFAGLARDSLTAALTATHRRVVEAVPPGGTILDVGSGGGAASLPAAPPAARIVAVDESADMLDAMVAIAADRVDVDTVPGRWPDVAGSVEPADVVVCANVAYNVGDLAPFVVALTDHARSRVVLELTTTHPLAWLAPLWKHFWDLDRPAGPTAGDALAVVAEATGATAEWEQWPRDPAAFERGRPSQVARARQRLCLPESADAEIARLLVDAPDPPALVTAWWPGAAPDV